MVEQLSEIGRRSVLTSIGGLAGIGLLSDLSSGAADEAPKTARAHSASPMSNWPQYRADAGHSGRVEGGVGPTGDISEVSPDAFDDVSDYIYDGVAVDGKSIYVGSQDLVAVNAATGQPRWRFEPTVPDHDYPKGDAEPDVGHPAVVDGTVYASVAFVGPGGRPSRYNGALIAVDATTGKQRWRHDTPGGVTYDEFSTVTVAEDTVVTSVAASDGSATRTVIGFATDGTERWRTQVDEMFPGALPVADGRVYIPSATGIRALDLATGEPVWTALPRVRFAPAATPMVADGTLFVAEEGEPGVTLIALDATTGEEHWRTAYAPETATPDMTIGTADETTVYITVDGIDRTVMALDRADGSERWRTTIDRPAEGTIPLDSFALVGGVLYSGAAALNPADGAVIWTHPLSATGPGWQLGAVADGRVYLSGTRPVVLTGTTE